MMGFQALHSHDAIYRSLSFSLDLVSMREVEPQSIGFVAWSVFTPISVFSSRRFNGAPPSQVGGRPQDFVRLDLTLLLTTEEWEHVELVSAPSRAKSERFVLWLVNQRLLV